ncbi:MAG: hypothetical protein ACUVRZ_00780 [Desulfobacca sp.]|uniref:hypothetical protein n=1 Tax=Desulfobacca sp. TaxID=2067990 RepID=UPI00404B274C
MTAMYGCPEETWIELAELPADARRIWRRSFWRAWLRVGGDCRRAAALAWQAFAVEAKGGRAKSGGVPEGRERAGLIGQVRALLRDRVRAGWVVVRQMLQRRGRRQVSEPWAKRLGQEDWDTVFAEAVARGWLQPEQRPWAEAMARQDGQYLREFFQFAAAAAAYQAGRDGGRRQWDEVS